MGSLKIFLVLAFSHCVFSGPLLKKSCEPHDTECIKGVVQDFFREHSAGIPDKGITAMDPVVIPELFEKEDEFGYTTLVKNLRVSGIKDAVVSDFSKRETDEDFTLKFDLDGEAEVTFTHVKRGKSYSGTAKYKASVETNAKFDFNVSTKNNLRFYELGPETITCEVDNAKITLNAELLEEFQNDPDAKVDVENYEAKASHLDEANICLIVYPVMNTLVQNLRVIGTHGV